MLIARGASSTMHRDPPVDADSTTFEAEKQQPLTQPRLVAIWNGGSVTAVLPRRGRCVIGRSREADVVLDHESVSRRHAALVLDDAATWEDLGSANGTRVRGKQLTPGEHASIGWDEAVEIGNVVVIVRAPYDATAPSAPRGVGTKMSEVLAWLARVATNDMSVLLLGETGVGKGWFARRLHEQSPRAKGPFVHINCAALPEHLLESELFGHERGAFTGAVQTKVGLLESASGGTIFLDEIGELTAATQAKLLVTLERREVFRVGALRPRSFDARFVSATNRAIEAEVSQGRFRHDLYYRLAGLPLVIPPLRERLDELPRLAVTFLEAAAQRAGRPARGLSPGALQALEAYEWPGNLRELALVLERAVLLSSGEVGAEHIALAMKPLPTSAARPKAEAPPAPIVDDERARIEKALDECAGNQSRAAKLLGVSRRTLINRIEEYGLKRPRK